MSVVVLLLVHFARLAGSYIVACLAAALIVVVALDPLPGAEEGVRVVTSIASAVALAVVIGGFAALPTLVVVAIAELFTVRALAYWLLAFGLVGALPFLREGGGLFLIPALDKPVFTSAAGSGARFLVSVAAGFVAGAVFWALAGRAAGAWRRPGQVPA